MSAIRTFRRVGCYDLLHPKLQEVSFGVTLPQGSPWRALSEICEAGDEYDPQHENDPFEMIEFIEARAKSYWLSTSRESILEGCAWVRANRATLERDWLDEEVAAARMKEQAAKKEVAYWTDRLAAFDSAALVPEIAEVEA